jgi:Na+-driven multidrug efflux pump
MLVSITTMWVFRVGLGYIIAVTMGYGVIGVWIAMFIDWVFRAFFFILRFASNKWMEKKLV